LRSGRLFVFATYWYW